MCHGATKGVDLSICLVCYIMSAGRSGALAGLDACLFRCLYFAALFFAHQKTSRIGDVMSIVVSMESE